MSASIDSVMLGNMNSIETPPIDRPVGLPESDQLPRLRRVSGSECLREGESLDSEIERPDTPRPATSPECKRQRQDLAAKRLDTPHPATPLDECKGQTLDLEIQSPGTPHSAPSQNGCGRQTPDEQAQEPAAPHPAGSPNEREGQIPDLEAQKPDAPHPAGRPDERKGQSLGFEAQELDTSHAVGAPNKHRNRSLNLETQKPDAPRPVTSLDDCGESDAVGSVQRRKLPKSQPSVPKPLRSETASGECGGSNARNSLQKRKPQKHKPNTPQIPRKSWKQRLDEKRESMLRSLFTWAKKHSGVKMIGLKQQKEAKEKGTMDDKVQPNLPSFPQPVLHRQDDQGMPFVLPPIGLSKVSSSTSTVPSYDHVGNPPQFRSRGLTDSDDDRHRRGKLRVVNSMLEQSLARSRVYPVDDWDGVLGLEEGMQNELDQYLRDCRRQGVPPYVRWLPSYHVQERIPMPSSMTLMQMVQQEIPDLNKVDHDDTQPEQDTTTPAPNPSSSKFSSPSSPEEDESPPPSTAPVATPSPPPISTPYLTPRSSPARQPSTHSATDSDDESDNDNENGPIDLNLGLDFKRLDRIGNRLYRAPESKYAIRLSQPERAPTRRALRGGVAPGERPLSTVDRGDRHHAIWR